MNTCINLIAAINCIGSLDCGSVGIRVGDRLGRIN